MNKRLIAPCVVFAFMVIFNVFYFNAFLDYYNSEGTSFNSIMAGMIVGLGIFVGIALITIILIEMQVSKIKPVKQ
jgi:hypothetical protein